MNGINYDALEAAGHELTLVQGITAGVSTYYCENCGALIQGGYDETMFHAPRVSATTESCCVAKGVLEAFGKLRRADPNLVVPLPASLREKLKARDLRRLEDMRRAVEE